MNWHVKTFDELSLEELYGMLQLRSEIFVVEQDCVYQDMDGLDQKSLHVLALAEGRVEAYVRILPPGLAYPEVAIGRVVVRESAREQGLGRAIMERAHAIIADKFTDQDQIKIMAQSYLLSWYGSLGYEAQGAEFLEDGIPHYIMVRKPL